MTMGIGGVCNSLYGTFTVLTLPDDDRGALYRARTNWSPRMRGAKFSRQNYGFFELWPRGGFSNDLSVEGSTWDNNEYEEWQLGEGGKRATYYIKGQVLDSVGAAIAGAVVKAFRTSDDLYVGVCTSDSYGNYTCPTPYPGVPHFIVAYLDIATDLAGTTVNNITPTVS